LVVTFPNMGNVAIAARTLFQALRVPFILPEANNKATLQTGAYYSPEEICLPFKLVLGNFIQCIEKGADTVLITGSCGPCRFGEYCELQMKILKRLGYQGVDFIVADLSSEVGVSEFWRRIRRISDASPVGRMEKIKALHTAYKVLDGCDRLDAKAHALAGYATDKDKCRTLLHEYKSRALRSESPEETMRLLGDYERQLDGLETDLRKDPIKISIIGEIFTVIEPFSNLYIEDKLIQYGVSTHRTLTPSWWVRNLLQKPLRLTSAELYRASEPYLPYPVGGHAKECIGEAVLAQQHGMDGAIQILPLGCMPEVVAKSVFPAMQKDTQFPIMTLIVDEVTGEAGYITRIEAFIDMLESRKRRKGSFAASRRREVL